MLFNRFLKKVSNYNGFLMLAFIAISGIFSSVLAQGCKINPVKITYFKLPAKTDSFQYFYIPETSRKTFKIAIASEVGISLHLSKKILIPVVFETSPDGKMLSVYGSDSVLMNQLAAYLFQNSVRNSTVLFTNFQLFQSVSDKDFGLEISYQARPLLRDLLTECGHSVSEVKETNSTKMMVNVIFRQRANEFLPEKILLRYLIALDHSSLREALVHSGLALKVEMRNGMQNPNEIDFYLEPNPMGMAEAVNTLLIEMHKMHRFDYISEDQLRLAKQQIALDFELAFNDFDRSIEWISEWSKSGSNIEFQFLQDSIAGITKRNLLNFIQQQIQNQSFILKVDGNKTLINSLQGLVQNHKCISHYELSYTDKEYKLTESNIQQLRMVVYLMNLSNTGHFVLHLTKESKKVNNKRKTEILNYLKSKGVEITPAVTTSSRTGYVYFEYEP